MTANLLSIQDNVLKHHLLPFLKIKTPLRLNSAIQKEAQNFSALGSSCKRLHRLVKGHFESLRLEYFTNLSALTLSKKTIKTGIILPLHSCVINNQVEDFLVLLRGGESVNSQDRCGRTALHIAVKLENRAFIEIILQHPDARTDLTTRNGKVPAEFTKNEDIRNFL